MCWLSFFLVVNTCSEDGYKDESQALKNKNAISKKMYINIYGNEKELNLFLKFFTVLRYIKQIKCRIGIDIVIFTYIW